MRLLTPRGAGGIAVVVLEGPAWRREAASLLFRGCRPFDLDDLRAPRLARLVVQGRPLDRVLVVGRRAPPRLELHLHGSEAVLEALARVPGLESRPPDPAEELLFRAASDAQLALALEQRNLDFEASLARLSRLPAGEREAAVLLALRRSVAARALAEAQRVVLCGARNAGKSTLMNRLLARERALAGARPGVTRDPVSEHTCLAGYPYELVDTAGVGAALSALDGAAQRRGSVARRGALGILVVDGSRGPGPVDAALVDESTVVICNKTDLPSAPWKAPFAPHVRISCVDREGWSRIRDELGRLLTGLRNLPPAGPAGGVAALNAAQEGALRRVLEGDTAS